MNASVTSVKRIIKKQVKNGTLSNNEIKMFKYYKVYPTPTENTKECLKYINFKDVDNALTAVEGLTQPFDITAKGVKNIDIFDSNALNEYHILGLMVAMFIKYDYHEFIVINEKIRNLSTSLEELTEILLDLLPYMDTKYRIHWKKVIDYNYQIQKENPQHLNLIQMLSYRYKATMNDVCGFLASEEEYNKFKQKLYRTNISFTRANPFELTKKFSGNEYDLIYLASSLDHLSCYGKYDWDYEFYEEYIRNLYSITRDFGGVIAANAINANDIRVWRNSRVTEKDLERHSVHKIPNAFDQTKKEDLLILDRKIGF